MLSIKAHGIEKHRNALFGLFDVGLVVSCNMFVFMCVHGPCFVVVPSCAATSGECLSDEGIHHDIEAIELGKWLACLSSFFELVLVIEIDGAGQAWVLSDETPHAIATISSAAFHFCEPDKCQTEPFELFVGFALWGFDGEGFGPGWSAVAHPHAQPTQQDQGNIHQERAPSRDWDTTWCQRWGLMETILVHVRVPWALS